MSCPPSAFINCTNCQSMESVMRFMYLDGQEPDESGLVQGDLPFDSPVDPVAEEDESEDEGDEFIDDDEDDDDEEDEIDAVIEEIEEEDSPSN